MDFAYCPTCGRRLEPREIGDEGLVPYCETCRRPHFGFSYSCVIVLPVNADDPDEVALIRQDYVTSKNHICVAGYVKHGETIEAAAAREVEEEIGLRVRDVRYMRSYYFERKDLLMLGFTARIEKADFRISGEVDSARWFGIDEAERELQNSGIALQLLRDYRTARG
ncbi:MAG: NUDIX domain-containing protein [Clostridia bacterium]|nr:NUDIX domain-containing protein [Clostridia bacterium]